MTTINAKSFGRYADRVQEWGGEFALPVNDRIEIQPSHDGGWCVVEISRGRVVEKFLDIESAVRFAESR